MNPGTRRNSAPASRSRRARLLAAVALSGGLVACGFRLRGTQRLPFDTVFIAAPHTSALKPELESTIRSGTSTTVLDDRAKAGAVIEILSESRERDVLSVNAQGRAREFRLRLRVVFRVQDGKGREYLGQTTVATSRDLAVLEEQLLAREYEAEQLYQDMLYDIAQQILRRVAVLKA